MSPPDNFFTSNDGKRVSNPLLHPSNAPLKAPKLQLWRHVVADDAALSGGALPSKTRGGANFGSYLRGALHIVPRNGLLITSPPGGTSQVAVDLLEWSAGRNLFVDTGVNIGPTAAGSSGVYVFDANGRILYFRVSGLQASESASLYIAASDEEDR
jgi:hypothetical protein